MALYRSSGRSWSAGASVARLHASRSYGFVLVLIMATFLFIMAAPEQGWTRSLLALLLCGTLIVAAWTSGFGWNLARTLGLITVGVAIAVVAEIFNGDRAAAAVWLVGFVLAAAIIGVIVRGVVDPGEVNRQSILGAICIYLLLGMLFSFAYGSAAKLGSDFFFAQGTDGTAAIRLYFSYITMATVGYGDYTVAGDLGRTLAILEGLLGQLYLVTVVALLVGRLRHTQSENSG